MRGNLRSKQPDDTGGVRPGPEERAGLPQRTEQRRCHDRDRHHRCPAPATINSAQACHRIASSDCREPGTEHHMLLQAHRRVEPGLLSWRQQGGREQQRREETSPFLAAERQNHPERSENQYQAGPDVRALYDDGHGSVRCRPADGAHHEARPVGRPCHPNGGQLSARAMVHRIASGASHDGAS